MTGENRSTKNNEDSDADSQETLRITTDLHDKTDREPQQTAGDSQQESCSSQVTDDNAEDDVKLEELSRQIESMSERFNQLFARVKAAELQTELRRSTTSLNETNMESLPRLPSWINSTADFRQRPSTVDRYSRNTAYRNWLSAKSGGLLADDNAGRIRQPITTANNDHVNESSVLIGQETSEDSAAAQQGVTSAKCNVTSEISVSRIQKATTLCELKMRPGENATNWSQLEINMADIMKVSDDLGTTLTSNAYDQEPSVTAEESSGLTYRLNTVPTSISAGPEDKLEQFNELRSEYGSESGHPSRSYPRSLWAQPEDKNQCTDYAITTTPTRPLTDEQPSRSVQVEK